MPVIIAAYALAMVTAVLLAARCWSRRAESPVAPMIGVIGVSQAMWVLAELGLLLVDGRSTAMALRMGALLFASGGTVAFLALTYFLSDRTWVPSRVFVLAVLVEPTLLTALAMTNHWHHLLVVTATRTPGSLTFTADWGPLYWWGHVPYIQALTVFAVWRLARVWALSGRGHRGAYVWILVAILPPIITNILWSAGAYRVVNLTPLAMTFTLAVAYQLVASRSLDHGPIAHRRVFHAVNDAVIVTDSDRRIVEANPAAVAMMRRAAPTISGPLVGMRIGEELAAMTTGPAESDQVLHGAWGSDIDVHVRAVRLVNDSGRALGWTFVGRDITDPLRRQRELREANERLRDQLRTIQTLRDRLAEQAVHDPLTDLYNRRHLMDRLAADTEGGVWAMSLAVIDLDRFKSVNDRYGHVCGDEVLVLVAGLLRSGIRSTDVLARHGGEEFVLYMPNTPAARAHDRVETLRARMAAARLATSGGPLTVTFSAGVATRRPGEGYDTLLQAADDALYAAKNAGRDQVVAAPPEPPPRRRGAHPVTGRGAHLG